ncbi:hypothetical protein Ddc_00495 [Ditylenchus destructor]|nr:hypothetical protein Ddc_00495 [Ditylenchus destructor]
MTTASTNNNRNVTNLNKTDRSRNNGSGNSNNRRMIHPAAPFARTQGVTNQRRTFNHPILVNVLWSKGAKFSKEAKLSGQRDSFRKADHLLEDMQTLDWLKFQSSKGKPTNQINDTANVQDKVWKCFIDRDSYMDVVKKFNTSNVDMLKEKQDQLKKARDPSEFDYQIRRCVAEPDNFPSTWELLKALFDEETLREYLVGSRPNEQSETADKSPVLSASEESIASQKKSDDINEPGTSHN